MRRFHPLSTAILAVSLSLGACSAGVDETNTAVPADETTNENISVPTPPTATVPPVAAPAAVPGPKVIGLEGLGDLRIGEPVPVGGSWAERGAQIGDACRTVSSPDYPGVYAIVTDGKVQRITVGQRSDVKLAEGVGVGATEKDVNGWFAGFREEPHKYQSAPAKYLTAPNAASGSSALRFEIGEDGKVSLIHVGTMPVLGYVEGCG